ncbi:hypothetical protein [Streptomyces sp. WMMC940]|uniref:hypothetical protein n=1 Tax=Streptomyces sp. WMMC940 TaxID=3015153 RepID=UPI0022B6DDA0|nr:hypothetical protein [Streptomyces sp. WMMC940]MCZ7461592.1 hypothetical protein [Streptomyces sp. WMMC940]
MRIVPLLLGLGWLLFGLAWVRNHRGLADRLLASPINLMPGDERSVWAFRIVGRGCVALGGFATVFGIMFLVFS